ncbi:hypothetical protein QR680_012084 [Steinernema hermaphroditum]|uniref:F-box domain-containing protein n=1 Tax=Steinernema hermaphroditum TaxID=289476 RepID=A0AA39I2F5_9BILA|nr:hypothetical protein QR680_012084 [Steinernema hermaphroditum]
MDQLPSDLVDHLAHFLSRKDLRTIARAAVGKRELNNWAVVAEDHQEERYLLDVDICLPLRNSNEQQKILLSKEYNPVAGYIMHPTRNSSLELDYDHFRIVKLEHQHLPVTADWIHALITKWKQGNGLRLHRETKKMNVVLTSEDEWHKLEQICGAAVKHRRSTILSVEHVLEHRSLELEMQDGRQFTEIQIQHKSITLEKLEALVAEWRAGDSGTVVEGLRKIDVYISKPVWKKFTGTDVDRPILSHELIYSSQEQYVLDRLYADEADRFIVHHPRVNGRLIFKSLKHSSPKGFYLISSVPVDPMDVEDWNLALLFGSLEI